jgi:signal peptidase I
MGSNRRWFQAERIRTALRDHTESLILALILALLVRWFVVSAFVVRSDSMSPILQQGDLVIGFKPPFGLKFLGLELTGRPPRRGEMVVFKCPQHEGLCLRRVVGLPGDRLEMVRQRLMVNGKMCQYAADRPATVLSEICLDHQRRIRVTNWAEESWGPIVSPPGYFFALSDLRADRDDSRKWGPIAVGALEASTAWIWLSLDWSASNYWPSVNWRRSLTRLN